MAGCAPAPSTTDPAVAPTQPIVVVPAVVPATEPASEPASDEPEGATKPLKRIDPEHGARLAAAEQAFESGNLDLAAQLFRELCQREERAVRGYACYRAAWTERARGDDLRALELIVRLLDLLDPPMDDHERRLRKATVADLPSIYARVGNPGKARPFFARYLDGGELTAALSKLAEQYDDQGKASEAATVRAQIP